MQSNLTTVFFLFFAPGILFCVFFGCDNTPRVRLVKDNDRTFHFQWDKPLKEERIILVHETGELGGKIVSGGVEWKSYNFNILVYFPAGSFVSGAVYTERWGELRYVMSWRDGPRRIHSIEILPAHLRNTVDFPTPLYAINDGDFVLHGDQVILRDHPSFQECRVDEPSRLAF